MNSVKLNRASRSSFDLSHSRKFSFQMGLLVPTFVMDCVPADRVTLSTTEVMKLAPMLAPIMHRVNVYKEYFNVPNRILWDGWSDYITSPGQPAYPVLPYIEINWIVEAGTLADYMGIPPGDYTGAKSLRVNALPFAGVVCVFNEYYRNQNLQEEMDYKLVDGDNTFTVIKSGFRYQELLQGMPLRRNRPLDLFTSALPFKQKGPAVTLDLGSRADIVFEPGTTAAVVRADGLPVANGDLNSTGGALNSSIGELATINNAAQLYADLASASSSTLETWRESMVMQRFLERNAVAGTRYTEFILAMFGVKSSDARLQRPEYLGGNQATFAVSEVLQTSETNTTAQGSYAGHGVSISKNRAFSYEQEEYSFLLGFVSVLPENAYMQGVEKMYTRFDPLDYLNYMFAHLGEQGITTGEIYAATTEANRNIIFGYSRQFYSYCQKYSTVHGEFQTTQDFWHMAEKYATVPVLNEEFIQSVPTRRIFPLISTDTDTIYCQMWHNCIALRQLPKYGTPM